MRRASLVLLLILASMLPVGATDNCSNLPSPAVLSDNGLARTPVMGWASWYLYGFGGTTNLTEANIKAQADLLVSTGLAAAGYTYLNLDDGWAATSRDGSGNIQGDLTRFSSGMASLATYIHSKGLKAGIYSSPYTTTCVGVMGSGLHESADASTFASWGYDFLKYDGCTVASLYPSCWPQSSPQVWQMMASAVRTAGRPMVLDIGFVPPSGYAPHTWGRDEGFNSWRINQNEDIDFDWTKFQDTIVLAESQTSYQHPGFWGGCDYLQGIGGSFTAVREKTQFGFCALWGGPLLLGMDLSTLTSDEIAMYSNPEVIAIDQDSAGRMAYLYKIFTCGSANCMAWVKPLHDGSWAIGLFNVDTSTQTLAIDLNSFGGSPRVRDLWAQSDLGLMSSYSTSVVAGGLALIKVTPPQNGTTLNKVGIQKVTVH